MDKKDLLQGMLAKLTGEDVETMPVGERWLERSINRAKRFASRSKRVRKPEPHFRRALILRQKKGRLPYPRG